MVQLAAQVVVVVVVQLQGSREELEHRVKETVVDQVVQEVNRAVAVAVVPDQQVAMEILLQREPVVLVVLVRQAHSVEH
jgi:hypothetical protein